MFKNYLPLLFHQSFRGIIVVCLTLVVIQPVSIQGINAPNASFAAPGFQNSGRWVSTSNPQIPHAYFPLIFGGVGAGIFGFVTQDGLPVNNVSITLRKVDGSTSTSQNLADTTTNGDGYYQFLDQNPLPLSQYYQVVYYISPPDPVPGRLAWWKTKMVSPTVKGQWTPIGNFDIADVALGNPLEGNKSILPVTFNWTPRAKSPSDSYRFKIVLLVPPNSYTDKYISTPSGYVDNLSFSSAQFSSTSLIYGTEYCWFIIVEAPDAASGANRYMRHITFLGTP